MSRMLANSILYMLMILAEASDNLTKIAAKAMHVTASPTNATADFLLMHLPLLYLFSVMESWSLNAFPETVDPVHLFTAPFQVKFKTSCVIKFAATGKFRTSFIPRPLLALGDQL